MNEENTSWRQSVGAVLIKDGKALVARHTYGAGKGKLIIPGGYLKLDEMPEQAATREVFEETGIISKVIGLVGVRFNKKDWYAVFLMEYISGEPTSDNDENSEVLFVDIDELLTRDDVPGLTKVAIKQASEKRESLLYKHSFHVGNEIGDASFYCI